MCGNGSIFFRSRVRERRRCPLASNRALHALLQVAPRCFLWPTVIPPRTPRRLTLVLVRGPCLAAGGASGARQFSAGAAHRREASHTVRFCCSSYFGSGRPHTEPCRRSEGSRRQVTGIVASSGASGDMLLRPLFFFSVCVCSNAARLVPLRVVTRTNCDCCAGVLFPKTKHGCDRGLPRR